MPEWSYAIGGLDPDKSAKASGRDLPISPKDARELCGYLRHMSFEEAKKRLEKVTSGEQLIPLKRHRIKVAHHRTSFRWPVARTPKKAAEAFLRVLKNVEANAENKGLDLTRLRVVHACAHLSMRIDKSIPRAHGSGSPYRQQLVHVEIAVEEK